MSIHTFTVEIEAPEFTSNDRLADVIREGLNMTVGRLASFTVNYTPNHSRITQPTNEMPWTPCNTCGSVSLRCGCD